MTIVILLLIIFGVLYYRKVKRITDSVAINTSASLPVLNTTECLTNECNFFVAGMSYNNDDGTSRQSAIKQCAKNQNVILKHTPTPKFPYAVAVFANNKQLGYVTAELAEEISSYLNKGLPISAYIEEIRKPNSEYNFYGCKVKFKVSFPYTPPQPTPLEDLTEDEIKLITNIRTIILAMPNARKKSVDIRKYSQGHIHIGYIERSQWWFVSLKIGKRTKYITTNENYYKTDKISLATVDDVESCKAQIIASYNNMMTQIESEKQRFNQYEKLAYKE